MYEVNMAGIGHRSARLSTSKWPKYVEITSIDCLKTCRYVGSKMNYVGSNWNHEANASEVTFWTFYDFDWPVLLSSAAQAKFDFLATKSSRKTYD